MIIRIHLKENDSRKECFDSRKAIRREDYLVVIEFLGLWKNEEVAAIYPDSGVTSHPGLPGIHISKHYLLNLGQVGHLTYCGYCELIIC
jgi:hypothetical protein